MGIVMGAVYDVGESQVYDDFYRGRGKDFAAEARLLVDCATRVRGAPPRDFLDVACGTGEHLHQAKRYAPGVEVHGVELSSQMCAIARAKVGNTIVCDDMRDFALAREFDLVTTLTSSIGYVATPAELARTVCTMARHLRPGGVLLVDPYWTEEQVYPHHVAADVVEENGTTIARLARSDRAGRRVRHMAHYLVTTHDDVEHFTHEQTMTAFTRQEYLDAITAAGLQARHLDARAFPQRGLFLGQKTTART